MLSKFSRPTTLSFFNSIGSLYTQINFMFYNRPIPFNTPRRLCVSPQSLSVSQPGPPYLHIIRYTELVKQTDLCPYRFIHRSRPLPNLFIIPFILLPLLLLLPCHRHSIDGRDNERLLLSTSLTRHTPLSIVTDKKQRQRTEERDCTVDG